MRTIFGLINKYGEARKAVAGLLDKNFDKEEINVIAQKAAVENQWDREEARVEFGKQHEDNLDEILGRQQPIPTNAAGELYATGEVARILARTIATPDAVDGGLEGAFENFGISDGTAQILAEGIQNGDLLLFLRTDDERVSEIRQIFDSAHASHISTLNG